MPDVDSDRTLAFGYDPASGVLTAEGHAASSGGGPTHLALGAAGGPLAPGWAAAHEGSGPHQREKGPHAHGVTVDSSGRWADPPYPD
ncbi:hypothetical protein [Novosphingobium resinovorum]|uniref:hypothetical protein n=1 Tax=Novosphingobium resinovorum TaxID=158500 RepID=UPI002ED46C63|nr:hypothetical protein [Novosphingobium resinovorum]